LIYTFDSWANKDKMNVFRGKYKKTTWGPKREDGQWIEADPEQPLTFIKVSKGGK